MDHYVCRQCKKAGDLLQFLMDFHNLKYTEACLQAGRTPDFKATNIYQKVVKNDKWAPREITKPCLTWQTKAEAVAFQAFKYLMSAAGKIHREYLHNRGISIESIKSARLGYNPNSLSFDRAAWGLDPVVSKTGSQKNIWIPEGFTIPLFNENRIVRIRIRQEKPVTNDRYILVAGSSTEYMSFPGSCVATAISLKSIPAFLVEAELDAILCNQEFGNLVTVYAIGNTTTRPDMATHEKLISKRIILSLDNDSAGAEETEWWKKQYGQNSVESHPVPIEFGKDPSEAFQGGLDLKQWAKDIVEQASQTTALKSAKKYVVEDIVTEPSKPIEKTDYPVDPVKPLGKSPIELITEISVKASKICLHGHQCISAKNGICLISKQHMTDIENCPKQMWYSHGTGNIRQIFYGVNFKK
jgi:DNA primase